MESPEEYASLKHLILIWKSSDRSATFCELADGILDEGRWRGTNFRPFDKRSTVELANVLTGLDVSYRLAGFINSNLLFVDYSNLGLKLAWHIPRHLRLMHFRPDTGVKHRVINIPGTVFYYNGGLRVYGYKELNGPDTKLFKGPFYNIGPGGDVCMGTITDKVKELKDKAIKIQEIMDKVEKFFFEDSYFSHVQDEACIKGGCSNFYTSKLTNLADSKLVPCGYSKQQLTLGDICSSTKE